MKATLPFGWTGLYVVVAILTVPIGASAQELAAEVTQNSELEGPRPQLTRLRFEVGLDSNFTLAGNQGNFGFGSYVRLGAQLKHWVDFQAELAAGTLLISWYVRGALTAGFTPVRWFTASVGPVIGYFDAHGFARGPTSRVGYAGATLRTDFHLAQRRAANQQRHSFTLGLAGDLGGAFGSFGDSPSSGLAVGAMLNLGYTMH